LEEKVTFEKSDILGFVPREFEDFEPNIIFHLAASFGRTKEYPDFFAENFENNVKGSHNVIEAAKACETLEQFIFASSYLVYAPQLYLSSQPSTEVKQLQEGEPVMPRNLTGLAKYYVERELELLIDFDEYNFAPISARIFRVYGRGSRDVIGRWIRAALNDEPITVFGKQNSFDYIHADDVAEGLIRLSEAENITGPFNLGSGMCRSISGVLEILRSHFPGLVTEEDASREGNRFEVNAADMSKFETATGWQPEIDLKMGMEDVIEFERRKGGALETHGNPYRTHRAYMDLTN
jgi:nucleoside-diphosphate-sugar epimerase